MLEKIKSKASSVLKTKFIENKILATYEENGVTYKVIDAVSSSPLYKSVRSLKFKTADSNIIYTHSAIYLDTKEKVQPYLRIAQDIISCWGKVFEPKNALVLGCAGCAIPRFRYLSYKDICIKGVEILPLLIDIANEYFFVKDMEDRLTVIQGDAFKVIKEIESGSEDIIMVDIFDVNRLPEKVFSDEFIDDIKTATSDDSLIIFNFLNANRDSVKSFAQRISIEDGSKYMVSTEERCFLALCKSKSAEKLKAFYKSLDNCEKLD